MALSLKISLDGGKVVKTTQFDPSTTVYDACRIIREKNPDICTGEAKDYGLFLVSDEEAKKGIWLEASRNLDYYILRNGDVLEYNKKIRNLRVRMLDGTVKTLLVDDSQVVANLMVVICTKIGITNYDEYGLVREDCKEEPDPCDKPHYGTLTLRRKHQDNKDRDVKMDMLRKKLRTDDEVNWVEPGKTLREQGVEISETLLLRRKLFFSDRNVDSRDPVQLNLLYVQARDAILDDTHPVTCDKACEFAGLQCQIQFGDHKEEKHTPGFLDLKEFLPTSYVKVKGIEKKVFREHRRHIGLSELDAKVQYTKSARALNTYGVAFFLVKEKMKGKNKLVPRLLGVSKDSVLRLDEKTKEPLQSWPLTTVRRWCASPNTFTLDFGDYSDQYYSVQTTEAEQILQVIAGYIDIILRKQRAKDHLGIEGDEGSAMMEDSVAPSKAHIIQHDTLQAGKVAHTECVAQPGVLRQPSADQKSYAMSHLTGAQHTTVSGQIITGHTPPTSGQAQQTRVSSVLSEPQRALLSTISSGREVIRQTETELIRAQVPDIGHDAASLKWKQVTLDSNKQAVTSHIAAMNAATAQVVTLTSGPTEEVDHTAVGAAITTITSNLPEMTKGVQMIAALMEDYDGGDKLLDATRKLCSAFSDLLRAAEPETKEPRQNLLNAASRVGEASTSVLHSIDEHPQDSETQDILLSLAKAVANTTAALVLRAKHVAAQCRDTPQTQHDIIAAATHCALATSQLVACTKVVASTLQSPQCRAQLAAAARLVSSAVDRLLRSAETSPSSAELNAAAAEVSAALQRLLRHASLDDRTQASETEVSVENVMSATERLVSAGDAAEMVRQARLLGQASAHLITSIKTDAEKQPSEMQRKLLAAAKLLADATASMVEAARQCASAPQDRVKQEALRKAAEELRYITVDYAQGQDIVGTQISRLQETAKQAASSATQLITTAHNAAVYNINKYSQETLHQECSNLSSVLPRVNQAVIASATDPSPSAHLELISASESMLPPSGHAISATRATIPSLDNAACAKRLTASANDYTQACADLRSAVSRARISCKGLEIDAAIEIISSLQKELDMLQDCELRPLPGQDSAWAYSTISHSTRSAAAATAQLVSGARHEAPAAPAAADLAAALRDYAAGVGAAAAAHPDQRGRLFSSSRQVLYNSQRLVELIKTYTSTSEQVNISTVTSVANSITQSMEKTLEAIPSHQELDMVTENINETLNIISMGEFPPSDRSYGELQEELQSAATQLNSASSDVVASVDRTRSLATAAQNYGDAYNRLVGCAAEMAAQQEDHDVQTTMVNCMKTVTVTSSKLLTTAKSVSQDLSRPNAKNQLAAAARDVTDAINQLVDVCTEASPTQRECEKAILRIQSAKPLLHDPTQAVTSLGYFASLDAVIDQSKGLSDGMSGMASSAKHSSPEQFAVAVRTVADSVCGLVECTAQAAYLVGISDETSVAGRPGLVDQAQFSRAALAIQQACRALSDPQASQQQVLSAATVIAKHTSALCNACRVASSKTTEAAPKRHFVQAAKDVANSTAALVKEIKMLDHDYNEVNRKSCAAATVPLQEAVRSLCQFADCPEFSAIPAKISIQAQESQRPMLDIGRNIISASCSMIEAGRAVALQPTDRVQWQSLADNSKHVSDSIKALVNTIREKAPGQRECTVATESLRAALREVDSAALAALAHNLPPRNAYTLQEYSSQIENSATEMLERVDPLRIAAKSEAENLGHAVTLIVSYVDPLIQWCVGAASLLTTEGASGEVLDKTKTVLESLAALVMAAKHSAGNPRATGAHPEVDEASRDLHSALQELRTAGRTLSAQHGHVQQLLDTLSANVARVTSHRLSLIGGFDETDSFVDYQTRMMACLKELVALSTDMNAAAVTNPSRLTDIGSDACALYEKIARDGSGAAQVHQLGHVGERIRTSVVELGEALQEAIRCGARCRMSSTAPTQRDMSLACKTLSEKAVAVLSTLQAGSKGTQACIEAAAKIAAVMGDLETTILFASAGTLQAEQEGAFSEHREGILQTAKRLVEDTKKLVGGANAPHDRLAAAAMDSTVTMVELAEVVKLGASVLGPSVSELQVSLLHAARDVSAALRDLCSATAAAAADKAHTPALRDAAKVMVTNVTSLLKTVKAVEDEHTRGLRALEATIEAIGQEITVLLSSSAPIATSTPSDLIRATRHMTAATARSATATTQDQYVAAANLGRKTVLDLLRACKSVAFNLDDQSHRSKVISAGQGAAAAFRALLMGVLRAGHDPQAKTELPDLARDVAAAVADITATVDTLKGSDWVDPDDPAVIAESELLGAAASIDAAAKKLEALRPRKSIKVQEADETLNFDEMILEAAKSIIAASSALVRAASASQRELIDQGKVSRRPSAWSDDGQWSEGLVSAARLVSAGAHALAESANALVQGLGSEERLISSATHVASCTAQLLVACKVKADPSSESTRRLQSAGAEVIRSTDNLVRAAKNAIRHEDERSLVLNRKMVGGIAQEIDARSEVLRIEKELEEARGRLSAIRQAKYKIKTGETSGEETDTDVYVGGYTSDSSAPHRYKNTTINTTNNTSFGLNTTYSPNSTYSPKHHTAQSIQQLSQSIHGSPYAYSAPEYNQHQYTQTVTSSTQNQNGGYLPKSPQTTFSSFKPQPQTQDDAQKQNYEGFTTRYETRLYDTPRPVHDYSKTEEQKQFESTQYNYSSSQERKSGTPKLASPLSPKFNARDLKFEDPKSDFYSAINKPSTPKFGDGIGQNFTETQRSTEAIPGGTKHTEFTIKSEAYSSFPKTEYIKSDTKEIKSPFVTSTPNKFEKSELNQYSQRSEQSSFGKTTSSDLVRVATPDRISSPYGKEVQSYGAPNYMEETTTEVKEIPNGTQKVTTTKVYSSSPVTMTTTNTKYEPIKLEGIDELSKSFDDESRYSTLDSKVSTDTSRSFLRPSDFHTTEYQTSVVKVKKPSELVKELDAMDKKFSKQTITSETIERRSVMTSSKKSETSSTVTKKFGNA